MLSGSQTDTRGYLLYDFICMTFRKKQNNRDSNQFTDDEMELSGMIELFSTLIIVVVTQVYTFVKFIEPYI